LAPKRTAPKPLAHHRILLANDDGILAPGFKVLERIARKLSDDVWVVAPETEQSAASHALSLHTPIRVRKVAPRKFAVNGTPTDSVFVAFNKVMKDNPPTLVLSGVNRGENLGDEATYSGTIAAAMEGTLLGVPSIALSLSWDRNRALNWPTAERWAPVVIVKLMKAGWPEGVLMNVNFPAIAPGEVRGMMAACQGQHEMTDLIEERIDLRNNTYLWLYKTRKSTGGRAGTDLHALEQNRIAVTPLHLDLTHRPTLKKLRAILE
jgi:5'-nucleotidase